MKLQRIYAFAFFFCAFLCRAPQAEAAEFFYKYKIGDKYRILSTVNQDIYVDRVLSYRSEIVNRITMEITGISGGMARHAATFQSAEKTVQLGKAPGGGGAKPFEWARDYESEFDRDSNGLMTISGDYYMPMVRNVPVFPGRDLFPGDTWNADGTEVHDFRDSYGIEKPYAVPFTANYAYLGEREWKGASYPAFSVSYRVFLEPDAVPGKTYPLRILGASDQVVYWDVDRGQAVSYEEQFRTIIYLSDGQVWEYRGRAEAEVVEAPPMAKEEMAEDIAAEVMKIPDASVRISDEGIVISLENIQFAPDSPVLMPGEIPKLDKIAEILMKYPDRDILVGGHTALAGTAAGRMQLSLERAGAVADYFIAKKIRSPERVVIRGYGAEQPMADNSTQEGMRKNRRVEITILEN